LLSTLEGADNLGEELLVTIWQEAIFNQVHTRQEVNLLEDALHEWNTDSLSFSVLHIVRLLRQHFLVHFPVACDANHEILQSESYLVLNSREILSVHGNRIQKHSLQYIDGALNTEFLQCLNLLSKDVANHSCLSF
jgi:hypothetical protein